MKLVTRLLKALFSIYAFLIFVSLLLILFPFVVIASFFGKVKGGNVIYSICRLWAHIGMFTWGMWHRNYFESPHNNDHPVVFVFNHISYMDIPVIMKSFHMQPVRVLGKAEMASIPLFGFVYKKAVIMVDRKSPEARARSVARLMAILRRNISIVVAPEGTFNTTGMPLKSFYDGAFRVAIETKTPVKPVIFLDTHDRLNHESIFSMTPGRSRSVFLEEISVEGLTAEDVPALRDKVYHIMEEALIRYKATWIKND